MNLNIENAQIKLATYLNTGLESYRHLEVGTIHIELSIGHR